MLTHKTRPIIILLLIIAAIIFQALPVSADQIPEKKVTASDESCAVSGQASEIEGDTVEDTDPGENTIESGDPKEEPLKDADESGGPNGNNGVEDEPAEAADDGNKTTEAIDDGNITTEDTDEADKSDEGADTGDESVEKTDIDDESSHKTDTADETAGMTDGSIKSDPAHSAISRVIVEQTGYVFTGDPFEPEVTVRTEDGETLPADQYTVTYMNNVNSGTATVHVDGKDEYEGESAETTFIIDQAPLTDAVLKYDALEYTGLARTQSVTAKVYSGNTLLTRNRDYSIAYSDNINIGPVTMTVTGKGNYKGELTRSYNIVRIPIKKVIVTGSVTYTGKALRPSVKVKARKNKETVVLNENTDYSVSYKNNKNAGTATVTVTGKGIYCGTIKQSFKIKAKKITSASIKYNVLNYIGKKRTQTNTTVVKSGGKILQKGTDYKITYKNNLNAGTAVMTITGRGNYCGTIRKTFTITKVPLRSMSLSYTSIKWTGKALKPAVTVKAKLGRDIVALKKGTDYSVSYKNNTDLGTATVVVKGKGNFTGILKRNFTIKLNASVSVQKLSGKSKFRCKVTTPHHFSNMRVAVWSDLNGQDDLTWTDMILTDISNGVRTWIIDIPYIQMRNVGKFFVHFYTDDLCIGMIGSSCSSIEAHEQEAGTFRSKFIDGRNDSGLDYVQAAISIAHDDYYGYDHTWKTNGHTTSCAGLVGLSLTYCGYGDFIKTDPLGWGYLDLGTYSGQGYNWMTIMEQEVGAVWHDGLDGIQYGDILYYDYGYTFNHTGIYLGGGTTVEARGPEGQSNYDDTGSEIAIYSGGLYDLPWQGYFMMPR